MRRRQTRFRLPRSRAARTLLLLIALALAAHRLWLRPTTQTPPSLPAAPLTPCEQIPGCFSGSVTRVIDGDTLDISGHRIRLVLVDAPEWDTVAGPPSTALLRQLCPEGSEATVHQDAWQPEDQYGRILGVVWCGAGSGNADRSANEQMIRSGRARLYRHFCRDSAFGTERWAVALGCL